MDEGRRRYFLLDREGVINRRNANGNAKCWAQFEFLPRALEAQRLLALNGYAGIVISRQNCECEGQPSPSELDSITRRFLLEVALSGGHIAQLYYCRHGRRERCDCYTPGEGMIERAKADHGLVLKETYFVSERENDLQAAQEAGCPCIRIQRDAFLQVEKTGDEQYKVASNLYEAAEQILAMSQAREREFAMLER